MTAAHTLSVLVVDDNRDGADSTADLLNLYGFSARAVYSAVEAEAEYATRPADVVVTDLQMRGEDGYHLAEWLRGRRSCPLLVAMTGVHGAGGRCKAAGFDHFFVKSADPTELVRVLAEHAARRP